MKESERKKLAKELEGIVGAKFVRADDATRWTYAIEDFSSSYFYPLSERYGPPDIVVKPQSTQQVSDIVKLANGYKAPIISRGGGEDTTAAATPLKEKGGILLDLTDMNRIINIDEGLNAVRFQNGIRWGELHHELAKKEITTGILGPHGFLGGTVGGCIAGNCFSINSAKYGWVGENVLNLQVVLPKGDIIETGSLANTKVKDWYFRYCNGPDLTGMFIGSAGALGVITEICLKTYPIPKFSDTLIYTFPNTTAGTKFLFEVEWFGYITEAFGIAFFTLPDCLKPIVASLVGERDIIIVTTEAYEEDILNAQKKAIDKLAKELGGTALPAENLMKALGATIIDKTAYATGAVCGHIFGPNALHTCSVGKTLRWEEIVQGGIKLVKKYEDALSELPTLFGKRAFMYVQLPGGHGVCNTEVMLPTDFTDPKKIKRAKELYRATEEYYLDTGLVAPYRIGKDAFCSHLMKRLKPEYVLFMKAIKKALDPNNIMNPGALGLGLEKKKMNTKKGKKLRIEEYKQEIWSCTHCSVCTESTNDESGWYKTCPVYRQLRFETYSARGHNTMALYLLNGSLKYSKGLADDIFKCTTCHSCEEICKPMGNLMTMMGRASVGGTWLRTRAPAIASSLGVKGFEPIHSVSILEAMRADCVGLNLQPEPVKKMAARTEKDHNPYGEPHADRLKWADGLEIPKNADTVFFVGCTPSYRRQEMAVATAKILKGAGIEFTVLPEEWCCGSPLIRTGNVNLGKKLIRHNVELLKEKRVKRLVTSCPGCYKTISKDWPKIAGELPFEVLHIGQFLDKLISAGKLKFKRPINSKITYHDPCHLGRAMGVYEEPRNVLKSIPGVELVEMYPTKHAAWCCGAGGGVKASNPDLAFAVGTEKIPLIKETGASILTTSCPFCVTNLMDIIEKAKEPIEVKDLTVLVAESMDV